MVSINTQYTIIHVHTFIITNVYISNYGKERKLGYYLEAAALSHTSIHIVCIVYMHDFLALNDITNMYTCLLYCGQPEPL